MNGLSLRTCLIIQNNPLVECAHGGPDPNGKYVGWVLLNDGRWSPLVSTEPCFDSPGEAQAFVEELVSNVRKLDLSVEVAQLDALIDVKVFR